MNSWEQLTIYNENGEQERLTFDWPFAQFGQRYPPNNESGQMLRASLFLSLSLSLIFSLSFSLSLIMKNIIDMGMLMTLASGDLVLMMQTSDRYEHNTKT